jgi:hypothetical protein
MNSTERFEIIDNADMICATASCKEDATYALQNKQSLNPFLYSRAYIFDTQTKKVVK